jgi:protein TonB
MSYAHPRSNTRRLTGLVVTVVLHIVLVYALIHGLARKIVEMVVPPLETKIIEEIKPPQPDKPPPPPPKLQTPPPPFIPPPEVNIQMPMQQPPTISVAPSPTPPAPVAIVPVPAPVQEVRTAPVVQAASCDKPEYPPAARRANETGTVRLQMLIDENGKVVDSKIERSSGSRRLDEAARSGLELCRFRPATVNGKPTRAWARLEYVWTLE